MDLIKIGKYIAFKRKEQGLTQKQLAEKLNMSDKSVSKWERGICLPDVSVYLELCKILDISINEFLAGEDIPKETIEQKAEENIIQITKDNKNKQKYLKKIIRLLIVMLVVFIFITSIFIYKKLTQPQNYIEPYIENEGRLDRWEQFKKDVKEKWELSKPKTILELKEQVVLKQKELEKIYNQILKLT